MTDRSDVTVRPLRRGEWSDALALTARAFADEPFVVGMLGDDPVVRYPQVLEMYGRIPWDPEGDHLGAFSGPALIGAVGVERAGRCSKCLVPQNAGLYGVNVVAGHARQRPDHGWVGRVAVEPCLQGNGIGGHLVRGALRHLHDVGTRAALLDAEVHRESYYRDRGFITVEHFAGSFDNTLALMLWEDPSPR